MMDFAHIPTREGLVVIHSERLVDRICGVAGVPGIYCDAGAETAITI